MELRGDQVEAAKDCFNITESTGVTQLEKKKLADAAPNEIVMKKVNIGTADNPKIISVGLDSSDVISKDVLDFFKFNEKAIVSSYIDMPGIDPSVAQHCLHVNENAKSLSKNREKLHCGFDLP